MRILRIQKVNHYFMFARVMRGNYLLSLLRFKRSRMLHKKLHFPLKLDPSWQLVQKLEMDSGLNQWFEEYLSCKRCVLSPLKYSQIVLKWIPSCTRLKFFFSSVCLKKPSKPPFIRALYNLTLYTKWVKCNYHRFSRETRRTIRCILVTSTSQDILI